MGFFNRFRRSGGKEEEEKSYSKESEVEHETIQSSSSGSNSIIELEESTTTTPQGAAKTTTIPPTIRKGESRVTDCVGDNIPQGNIPNKVFYKEDFPLKPTSRDKEEKGEASCSIKIARTKSYIKFYFYLIQNDEVNMF